MSSTSSSKRVQATVVLVGLGKRLVFKTLFSSNWSLLPDGHVFECPPYLWNKAWRGTSKTVTRTLDPVEDQVVFRGELAFKQCGGSTNKYWRPV